MPNQPGPTPPRPTSTLACDSRPGPLPLAPTAQSHDPLLGQQLGNFRIVRRLGAGGMGVVYLAEHTAIGSRVAVKLLHPHLAADSQLVERFFSEARAVNLIGHDNIVSIFDLNLLPPDRYYLVMEHLEGQSLSSLLGNGPLDLAVGIPILVQICDALEAAHSAGIIHRDLKPDNVFLIRRADNPRFVKVLDFGIAKLFDGKAGPTAAGLVVGTPEYMPPEQWGDGKVDGRLDLYALGVIAYAMASGRVPFTAENVVGLFKAHLSTEPPPLRPLNPAVPPGFEALIRRALAKRPEDRFQSAAELKAALLGILENRAPAPAAPATPTPVAPPRPPSSNVPAPPREPEPAANPQPPTPPTPRASTRVHRARITWATQSRPHDAEVLDLSRAGAFVRALGPVPPLFARLSLSLLHGVGSIDCEAEVVRHVSAEQARSWGLPEGFAVQFTAPPLGVRDALDRLARGELPDARDPASGPPRPDDPAVERVLERYRRTTSGDPYALLAAPFDAECGELRHRARQAIAELDGLAARMSSAQALQGDSVLERLHAALAVLGTPAWRADHDAGRGNFRGVARCLAAGLSVVQLQSLRSNFLAARPGVDAAAQSHQRVAISLELQGGSDEALASWEKALHFDPLNLALHQRYWALRHALARGGGG